MSYQVRIERVEAQPLAVVRRLAKIDELSRVVPAACGEVWNFIRANGIRNPGRHVAVYLDCKMNIEVGAEVPGPFVSDGNVVASSIPAGRAATTTHMGPYQKLGDAHNAVQAFCKEHGHALAGVSWEIYGHWTDEPAKLRTDVYWLLK
jgi:effector-binding domain-containing protein